MSPDIARCSLGGPHRSYLGTTAIEEKGWLSGRLSRGMFVYFLKVTREEAKKQHKGKCRSVRCPGSIGVSCGWRHLHPEGGGEPRKGCKLGRPQGDEDLSVCRREPEGQEPVRKTELRPDLSLERSQSGLFLRSSLGGPIVCCGIGAQLLALSAAWAPGPGERPQGIQHAGLSVKPHL